MLLLLLKVCNGSPLQVECSVLFGLQKGHVSGGRHKHGPAITAHMLIELLNVHS